MNLTEWIEKNNLGPEDLDELVHTAANEMASNANNDGIQGQISFLKIIAGWSNEDIIETLS